MLIKGTIKYQLDGIVYESGSDPLARHEQHKFELPFGASAVFLKIQTAEFIESIKTIYENTYESFENVCIQVTGTIFQANAYEC